MITTIECSNFYSIGATAKVVFFDEKKLVMSLRHSLNYPATLEQPVFAMIGPNASGKTNVLKTIPFIKYLICETYLLPEAENRALSFEPYAPLKSLPTSIRVRFLVSGRLFEYSFLLSTDRILEEKFSELGVAPKRFTKRDLFSRRWAKEREEYTYSGLGLLGIQKKEARKDASLITIAARQPDNAFAKMIFDYWSGVTSNIYVHGHIDDSMSARAKNTISALSLDENSKTRDAVKSLLQEIDPGFVDFSSETVLLPNGASMRLYSATHSYNNLVYTTPIDDESSGTKRLISILSYCVMALNMPSGGVVIIDEIEAFIHPLTVQRLINMFNDSDINKNHSQIIMSTHSLEVLKTLKKKQLFLVDKINGATNVRRLSEIKSVRADSNFLAEYLSGRYGALPPEFSFGQ